ncbi:MAG: hypothetical protein AB8B54_01385 [Sphingorhabdus sp.]
MAAPLPILYLYFPTEMVAWWLLLVTLQSIIGGLSGSLPSIATQMLSYAHAGSRYLSGDSARHRQGRMTHPNEILKALVNSELRRIFAVLAAIWATLALTLGWVLSERSIMRLTDPHEGYAMGLAFIALSAMRFLSLPALTYLLAVGETARARFAEAWCWLVGGIASAALLYFTDSALAGIVALFMPLLLHWLVLRAMAKKHGFNYGWDRSTLAEDRSVATLVWERAWKGTSGTILGMAVMYGSGLIYAQSAQAEEQASFLLALNLLGFIQQFAMAPLMGVAPALGARHASDNIEGLIELSRRATLKGAWLYIALALPVPLVMITANAAGLNIPFVSVDIWLAFAVAMAIVRHGANHLHILAAGNEIRFHKAAFGLALLYLGPLLLWSDASLLIYALLLAGSATVYAGYARSLTLRAYKFPLKTDGTTFLLPLLALMTGWLCYAWVPPLILG